MDTIDLNKIDFNRDANKLLELGLSEDNIISLDRYGRIKPADVMNNIINNRTLYFKVVKPVNISIIRNLEHLNDAYLEILINYLNINVYNGYIPDEILNKIKIIMDNVKKNM
jgi:hypothetical protein